MHLYLIKVIGHFTFDAHTVQSALQSILCTHRNTHTLINGDTDKVQVQKDLQHNTCVHVCTCYHFLLQEVAFNLLSRSF